MVGIILGSLTAVVIGDIAQTTRRSAPLDLTGGVYVGYPGHGEALVTDIADDDIGNLRWRDLQGDTGTGEAVHRDGSA